MGYNIKDQEIKAAVVKLVNLVDNAKNRKKAEEEVYKFIEPFIHHYNTMMAQYEDCAKRDADG